MATCPDCDAEIEIDDHDLEEMEVGDPWDCDACGTRLRVAGLTPLDFDSDDEDDDDDEEEEEKAEEDADPDADAEDEDGDGDADKDWDE